MAAIELVGRRSRDSKTFQIPNGRRRVVFTPFTHYQDDQGAWQDVDLNFRFDGLDRLIDKHLINFRADASGIAIWHKPTGRGIKFEFPKRPDRVVNRTAEWDLADGTTWRLTARKSGLKTEATVVTKRGPKTYTFAGQMLGGLAPPNADGNGNLVQPAGHFTILRPEVYGANGVTYQTSGWSRVGANISFSFDDTALPNEALPYVIDPTTEFSVAASGDDGYVSKTSGAYPPSGTVTVTTNDTLNWVNKDANFSIWVVLLRWDTSSIPDDATVDSATLRLRITNKADTNARSLTAEWYESGTIDAADYTDTVGSDAHSGTTIASITTGADNDFALVNLSSLSKTGYTGLRLHLSGGEPTGNNNLAFASFDHATLTEPRLIVEYTEAGGGGGGLDTRSKRASAIYVGMPWRGVPVLPDGSLSAADRAHTAYMYGGLYTAVETNKDVATAAALATTNQKDVVTAAVLARTETKDVATAATLGLILTKDVSTVAVLLRTEQKDVVTAAALDTVVIKDVASSAKLSRTEQKDVATAAVLARTEAKDVASAAVLATTNSRDAGSVAALNRVEQKDVATAAALSMAALKDASSVAAVARIEVKDVGTEAAIEVANSGTRDVATVAALSRIEVKDVLTAAALARIEQRDVASEAFLSRTEVKDIASLAVLATTAVRDADTLAALSADAIKDAASVAALSMLASKDAATEGRLSRTEAAQVATGAAVAMQATADVPSAAALSIEAQKQIQTAAALTAVQARDIVTVAALTRLEVKDVASHASIGSSGIGMEVATSAAIALAVLHSLTTLAAISAQGTRNVGTVAAIGVAGYEEQQRALDYRRQQQARENNKLVAERALAGSVSALQDLEADFDALRHWEGWTADKQEQLKTAAAYRRQAELAMAGNTARAAFTREQWDSLKRWPGWDPDRRVSGDEE